MNLITLGREIEAINSIVELLHDDCTTLSAIHQGKELGVKMNEHAIQLWRIKDRLRKIERSVEP